MIIGFYCLCSFTNICSSSITMFCDLRLWIFIDLLLEHSALWIFFQIIHGLPIFTSPLYVFVALRMLMCLWTCIYRVILWCILYIGLPLPIFVFLVTRLTNTHMFIVSMVLQYCDFKVVVTDQQFNIHSLWIILASEYS